MEKNRYIREAASQFKTIKRVSLKPKMLRFASNETISALYLNEVVWKYAIPTTVERIKFYCNIKASIVKMKCENKENPMRT